jgi:predicted membrane channel-forming protein YqfA (hemolysin III family)
MFLLTLSLGLYSIGVTFYASHWYRRYWEAERTRLYIAKLKRYDEHYSDMLKD